MGWAILVACSWFLMAILYAITDVNEWANWYMLGVANLWIMVGFIVHSLSELTDAIREGDE